MEAEERWWRGKRRQRNFPCPDCGRRIMWDYDLRRDVLGMRYQIRLEHDDLGIPGLGEFEWQGKRAPIRREGDMVGVQCFACGWGHIYSRLDFLLHVMHEGRL